MECVKCVYVWLWWHRISDKRGGVGEGVVDDRIGLGVYQSCGNRGSVGRVSIFGLWWCMWGVSRGLYCGFGTMEEACLSRSCYDN